MHRVIGAYAPWDPGQAATSTFWPALTDLCRNTTTSWTLGGDLNATVSATEHAFGGADACAQFLAFLDDTGAHDIWTNHPDCNHNYDWTSRPNPQSTSSNIIDRIITSKRSLLDSEILVTDGFKDFVPFTNHQAVVANIVYMPPSGTGNTVFPVFNATLNKSHIKYPTCMEKHRHNDFRAEMEMQIDAKGIADIEVLDDTSVLNVYDSFTEILIPVAEKYYGRIAQFSRRADKGIMSPKIEKLVAKLRFIGGAIRNLRSQCASNVPWSTNRLHAPHKCLLLRHPKGDRPTQVQRSAETRMRKEKTDRACITTALKSGSTKHLITPGEFIEMPITVNEIGTEKFVSDPAGVKAITRDYWSNLYHHALPPAIPKPWLTTKSVLDIKQRVQNDPFVWPRKANLADF
ncbi:hypothetical protein FB451DRAFT_1409932 [Mycena latifolia]|nr:hypothetical protein FB451DRAFT_1409932 [Mycena latifolia]